MLHKTIERGLLVIYNCLRSPFLEPAVSEQVVPTLLLYLDPDTNDPYRVIDCISIMEMLEMRDQLCRRAWPDSILEAVSGLLTRAQYNQEHEDIRAPTNQDGLGMLIPAGDIQCMMGISRSARGSCQVLNLLQEHQPKLSVIITRGDAFERTDTKKLLTSLISHSCITRACRDKEWISNLLQECAEAEHGNCCMCTLN